MSVVAACKFDDLVFSGETSCCTDGTHNSLCSGVYHTNHIYMRNMLTDKFCNLHFNFRSASKAQAIFAGLDHALTDFREIMPQDHRAPGINVIHITVSVHIIDVTFISFFNKTRCLTDGSVRSYRAVYTSRNSFYRTLK